MQSSLSSPSQELIFLDPDDDLATIRAKLESTAADEVFLVLPGNASVLRTPLEFRILGRLASELSSETVLVTSDSHRRFLARQEGFRTRGNLRGLRHLMTPGVPPNPFLVVLDWLPLPSARTGMLLLTFVAAALLFSYFVLPEMRVTMVPNTELINRELDVTVSSNAVRLDPGHRIVPGRSLEQRLEVRSSVDATGTAQIGRSNSLGEIQISNQRGDEVRVPRGSVVVAANGVRFSIESDVTVPPRGRQPARSSVLAVEPGSQGNVPAGAINRFEDPRFSSLQVTNPRPTTGGSDREGRVVSEEDIARLREELQRQARDEAAIALQSAAGADTLLPDEAVHLEVLDERIEQQPGAAADRVSGRMTVRATTVAARNEDVTRLVGQVFTSQLSSQYVLAGGVPNIRDVSVRAVQSESIQFAVRADAVAVQRIDEAALEDRLRGKTVDEATSILASMEGLARPPRLEFWPEWASRAFRVDVDIVAPR